jgi:hypothetical protein
LSVITVSSLHPAAASSDATLFTSVLQCRAAGLRGVVCSSVQAKAGGDVDRGVLPDRSFRAREPADVEAVKPDQLTRLGRLDMPLWLGLGGLALVDGRVARDQGEPFAPRVQPVPFQHPPDAVRRDPQAAPLLPRQLGADPLRAEPGLAEREGDDPLLQMRPELVRHPRPAPLPRPQRLQAPPLDLLRPAVIGRVMHTHRPASRTNTDLAREREQPQPIAEQHVILRHATPPSHRLATKRRA